ncbi:RNA-directed DNA polymerase, eukaryota, reverse transcriptase zinc-binding domain protein [Tanacetum coccineum]
MIKDLGVLKYFLAKPATTPIPENTILNHKKSLGGFWVLIEFLSKPVLEKFKSHVGVRSWFSSLHHASNSFRIDKRIAWVDIEGVPLKVWMKNTFTKISSKWGEILYEEDKENLCLNSQRVFIQTTLENNIFKSFKIFVHRKFHWFHAKEVFGWVPDFMEDEEVEDDSDKEIVDVDSDKDNDNLNKNHTSKGDRDSEEVPETLFDHDHVRPKQTDANNDGAKYPPGYTPVEDVDVKSDFVYNLIREENASNRKVYEEKDIHEVKNRKSMSLSKEEDKESGCSEVSEKKMIWNYLNRVIDNWNGGIVIMEDFNEVHSKDERYGSLFNGHSAAAFNSFISLEGLEGFDKVFEETWRESTISDSNAISKFMKKLKFLKDKICLWTKPKNKSSKSQKLKLKGMLSDIYSLIDNKIVDQKLLNKRLYAMNSLHDLEKLESSKIAQNVKIKWEFPYRLNSDQKEDMERNVTKEETKRVVWDCGMDKSSGPDGFMFGFYRRYWGILEKDVVDAVSYFFKYGTFPRGGNLSFIAMIPKMQDAKLVKDFRPISLIASMYKIIAKTLANRLVVVLGDIMNEVQSNFVTNSKLLGVAVDDEKVNRVVKKIWCLTLKTSFSYLGIKIGGLMSRINSWDDIVASLHSRLSKCKMKTLSISGRLTLLKSVFGSMPVYYMSMFKVPSQVCHFRNDSNSLWGRVIKALHAKDGRLGKLTKSSCPSVWIDFVNELHKLKSQDIDLLSLMNKKVGNGVDTLFWEEAWRGDITFKSCFPRVYVLESNKLITVAAKLAHEDLGYSLRRMPRDGVEMMQFLKLKVNLDGFELPMMQDRWLWSLVGSGNFLLLRYDALPTRLNLSTRGLDLQSIFCPICNKEVESSSHIFFACSLCPMSWKSKKQPIIFGSSAEAEYRCMAAFTCEVIWICNVLSDLEVTGLFLVDVLCDSSSPIQIASNHVFHEKTKHFEINVHIVREKVAAGYKFEGGC